MKRLLLLCLTTMLAISSWGYDLYVDGIYYNITTADGSNTPTVEVTSKSDSGMTATSEYQGDMVIPETVTKNGVTYTVTGIAKAAFTRCQVTTVSIPNTVTSLGANAFEYSTIESITIPSSITIIPDWLFTYCDYLREVTLPETLTAINYVAFAYCPSLQEITIPNSVTTLGQMVFVCCSGLKKATIGSSITTVPYGAFGDCSSLEEVSSLNPEPPTCESMAFSGASIESATLSVPAGSLEAYQTADTWKDFYAIVEILADGDKFLSDGLYYQVTSAENKYVEVTWGGEYNYSGTDAYVGDIEVPSSTTYNNVTYTVVGIGESAFRTSKLTSISLPSTITYIGDYAFSNCSSLTEVEIPEQVTEIADYTFYSSKVLNKVTIPDNVYYIGEWAFASCSALEEITLPSGLREIATYAFRSCPLTSIDLPQGLLTFGIGTFYHCEKLTEITIPEKVSTLDTHLFNGCSALTTVNLHDKMTTFNNFVFQDCTSLVEFIIPETVSMIGQSCFKGCTGLSSLYSMNETPPFLFTTDVFESVPTETCVLYVPEGSYDEYRDATTWGNFLNIVEMVQFAIKTLAASDVTDASATLNGSVKAAYNDPIVEKGFEYWTGSSEPTTIAIGGDDMVYTLENLSPNTTYAYRAYAVMESDATEYGDEVEFTTLEDTTGINGVSIGREDVVGIYSIEGQRLNNVQRGVNIIHYSDGTVKKVYISD